MLKMRELHEVPVLFDLLSHPSVFPFVRQRAETSDEFYFVTKQTIEAEERGELISRTILDEYYQPIGTINLFDIQENHGFLATWIGEPYFGRGYNKQAKEQFFDELFLRLGLEGIFMKVRRSNIRSLKAALKLPYAGLANETHPDIYKKINQDEDVYDLFVITRSLYTAHQAVPAVDEEEVS
ncbi:GNAT family N-acetyltransferase [Lentibacillus sediminis]|uniref:GNAT family N-acetyltransferase n=1 Tax=Lentibacillus sediminis TaxID=1940529 RepID=UPI000C1B8149|nr:GNAT family protein [Lentibacillus sediminis]